MAEVMYESSAKRARLDESDIHDDSCASEESWRGYETAWVKDSGDDWSPSSSSDHSDGDSDGDATDVIYEVEYEIASDSDITDEIDSGSDDSDDDDVQAVIVPIIAATYELEEEGLAGSDTTEDGIIRTSPVVPVTRSVSDRWKCLRCGILNVPPMRYCHKCYEIRKEWLDPRPKRRKGKKPRESSCQSVDSALENGSVMDATPSTSSSTSSSQNVDSGISSQSSIDEPPSVSCSSVTRESSGTEDLCGLCGLRQINGAFTHGNTGHEVYCYPCSKRVWRERKKCPVCRRTIAKVIKMFRVTSS